MKAFLKTVDKRAKLRASVRSSALLTLAKSMGHAKSISLGGNLFGGGSLGGSNQSMPLGALKGQKIF